MMGQNNPFVFALHWHLVLSLLLEILLSLLFFLLLQYYNIIEA